MKDGTERISRYPSVIGYVVMGFGIIYIVGANLLIDLPAALQNIFEAIRFATDIFHWEPKDVALAVYKVLPPTLILTPFVASLIIGRQFIVRRNGPALVSVVAVALIVAQSLIIYSAIEWVRREIHLDEFGGAGTVAIGLASSMIPFLIIFFGIAVWLRSRMKPQLV